MLRSNKLDASYDVQTITKISKSLLDQKVQLVLVSASNLILIAATLAAISLGN